MTPLELVAGEGEYYGTFFVRYPLYYYPDYPLLAGAQVACGAQAGEPCPPDCPAPSPTPTATTTAPTATTAPTTPTATTTAPTAAPSPVEPGSMAVDCAAAAGIQSACEYASGASVRIQVHVTEPPSEGYFGFHTKLPWSDEGLDYIPASAPAGQRLVASV